MTTTDPNESIALKTLSSQLGNVVHIDSKSILKASFDGLKVSFPPSAVIRPEDVSQVGEVLRLANEFCIPVTTKGAGSSLTGGATPVKGGWVLDLSLFNQIEIDVDNQIARCGPGAIVADIQEYAAEHNLFYPPDPSSKMFCTIGGNIACNAGGLRCVKYGVTRDYILSLSGYLPTGEAVKWGRATRKFATGYNIRDLWIGSEGTLWVVTEAVLRLVGKPVAQKTFLAAFRSDTDALRAPIELSRIGIRPSILEFLDRWTIECVQSFTGREVFQGISPHPVLLIELDGDPTLIEKESHQLINWLKESALCYEVAGTEEEAEELWDVRRKGSPAMKKLANTKLNEDVVVPLVEQANLVECVDQLRQQFRLKVGVFGHCGDGNLHVNFMYDHEDEDESSRAVQALKLLMKKVHELGGAISGEHGIGLAKTPFVRMQFNAAEWKTMKAIKEAMDPNGILNPGKIFDIFNPWEQKKINAILPWEHSHDEPKPVEI
jgi:glycolate oxidase